MAKSPHQLSKYKPNAAMMIAKVIRIPRSVCPTLHFMISNFITQKCNIPMCLLMMRVKGKHEFRHNRPAFKNSSVYIQVPVEIQHAVTAQKAI